jgi:hypothetical protein
MKSGAPVVWDTGGGCKPAPWGPKILPRITALWSRAKAMDQPLRDAAPPGSDPQPLAGGLLRLPDVLPCLLLQAAIVGGGQIVDRWIAPEPPCCAQLRPL